MITNTTRTAKSVLGVFAASLVASTLLTGSLAVTTAPAAFAQGKIEAIDPTKGFAPLVEHVMPSVVSVEVKFQPAAANGASRDDIPPQMREFFEQFPQFRDRFEGPRNRGGSAVGSGFVISADGYVVTNNHVVKDASEVKLNLMRCGPSTSTPA